MSHDINAFTIDNGRSASHYRNTVTLLIACAVGNILTERVYALDSPAASHSHRRI